MNEKNIVLLAALGFGAYFIMSGKLGATTKRPTAPAAGAATQSQQPNTGNSLQNTVLAGGLGIISQLLGRSSSPTPYQDALNPAQSAALNPWGLDDLYAVNSPLAQYNYFDSPLTAPYTSDTSGLPNYFNPQW